MIHPSIPGRAREVERAPEPDREGARREAGLDGTTVAHKVGVTP